MSEPLFTFLPTDTLFDDSPDAGDPSCLCSRCGQPIAATEFVVRAWPDDPMESPGTEYRFHPACLGMEGIEEPDVGETCP